MSHLPLPVKQALRKLLQAPLHLSPEKKEKKYIVVEFLKEESESGQRRHEESEAKTECFLTLFERMVDEM